MYSKEEKEAIEVYREFTKMKIKEPIKVPVEDMRMLINLIDKQQKEIEEDKKKIKEKIKELEYKEFLYKEEKRFNEEEIKFNYAKRILQGILGEENE